MRLKRGRRRYGKDVDSTNKLRLKCGEQNGEEATKPGKEKRQHWWWIVLVEEY
jgi:hypothetical protein